MKGGTKVSLYPGRVGGEKCFSSSIQPGYEARSKDEANLVFRRRAWE